MKLFLSILFGAATFLGVFILDGFLINLIVSPLHGDTRIIVMIALWVISLGFAAWLAAALGLLVAGFFYRIIRGKND